MGNPILDQIDKTGADVSSSINSAISALTANSQNQQSVYDQNVQINLDLGKQAQIIQAAKDAGEMAAQADKNTFALAVGGDIGDTTGTLARLAGSFITSAKDQAAALDEVNQKKQISPFEDPIGWIQAQFTMNDSINKYNAATTKKNQAESTIDSINKMVQQRALSDNALKSTTNDAAVAASSAKLADEAAIKANADRLQALTSNATTIEKITSLGAQQLNVLTSVMNAHNQQEELGMARERMQMAREEYKDRQKKQADIDIAQEQLAADITRGLSIMYSGHPEQIGQIASPATMAQIRGGMPMSPLLKQAYEIGVLNRVTGDPQQRMLANSPWEMREVLAYKPDLSPAQMHTAQLILDTEQLLAAKKVDPKIQTAWDNAIASKDKNAAQAIFNDLVNQRVTAEASKVDGPTSLFYLPSIDKIVNQFPNLQSLELSQKVIAPAVVAKVDLSDPSQVVKLAAQAVKMKTMTMNQAAADLRTIYGAGALQGQVSRSLVGMGLNPPHSYNVRIQDSGRFSSNIVDMTDTQQVLKALMNQMVSKENAAMFQAGLEDTP